MNKKTIKDINVNGKKVIVRVDYNVPLTSDLKVADNTRIERSLDTVKTLLDNGAAVILMSHLGRPKGKVDKSMSLKPVAEELSKLINKDVTMLNDCIGEEVENYIKSMKTGDICLLENLRFHKEEKNNDPEFAKKLASLADIYVNDAFGTAHRAHASTEGITKYLPAVAGFLMEKEITYLGSTLENPEKPFTAIVGGAKVSTKIDVLKSLFSKAQNIIIGGAMSYTFFKALGYSTGNSLVEKDYIDTAKKLIEDAKANNVELILPVDNVIIDKNVGDIIKDNSIKYEMKTSEEKDIPDGWTAVDIGDKSIEKIKAIINSSKTVIWNGPLGVYEVKDFAKGTNEVANILAYADTTSIIGGGDVVAAVNECGVADRMSHVSTGGGASLEMMEGKTLPGLAALNDK
ncbi:MAG: phosphoglycerate kinase [Spirochaetota bacterium]